MEGRGPDWADPLAARRQRDAVGRELSARAEASGRRRRRRRWGGLAAGLVLIVAAVTVFVVVRPDPVELAASSVGIDVEKVLEVDAVELEAMVAQAGQQDGALWLGPRPPAVAGADAPLGRPPEVEEGGSVEFLHRAQGRPVAFDPCRPIRYVVAERTMPEGAEDVVEEAIDEISDATGLVFVSEGTTDEVSIDRAAYDPARDGDSWPPVLIGWSDTEETVWLARLGAIGLASSWAVEADDGTQVFVTGQIALDGPALGELMETEPEMVTGVVLHELGHLVGLAHVEDRDEIMGSRLDHATDLGPGDRFGLAQLGEGPCVPLL